MARPVQWVSGWWSLTQVHLRPHFRGGHRVDEPAVVVVRQYDPENKMPTGGVCVIFLTVDEAEAHGQELIECARAARSYNEGATDARSERA